MLDAAGAHHLVETYREGLLKGQTTFLDLVRNEDLLLAADLMVPFAHWITPETQPKRFDTHFLLVSAPVEQLGAHDGGESVEGFWIAPRLALQDAAAAVALAAIRERSKLGIAMAAMMAMMATTIISSMSVNPLGIRMGFLHTWLTNFGCKPTYLAIIKP